MQKNHFFLGLVLFSLPLGALFSREAAQKSDLLDLKRTLQMQKQEILGLKEELTHSGQEKSDVLIELENEIARQQIKLENLTCRMEDNPNSQTLSTPCCPLETFRYRPPLNQCGGYLTGEFLYWKTLSTPTYYVVTKQPYNTDFNTFMIGDVRSTTFDHDPGFRFSLGYRFAPNHWEVGARYTFLNNKGHDEIHGPIVVEPEIIVATYQMPFVTANSSLAKASADIELIYQTFDLSFIKRFLFSDSLLLNLFAGFSGAWIDQDWTIEYGSGSLFEYVESDWRFFGGGLKMGLNSDWNFCQGWSLFSEISVATLVGSYKNSLDITQFYFTSSTNSTQVDTSSLLDDTRAAYYFHFLLGPSWGKVYPCWGVKLFVGYELDSWFNLHEITATDDQTNAGQRLNLFSQGTLCLQGLTANLTFNF